MILNEPKDFRFVFTSIALVIVYAISNYTKIFIKHGDTIFTGDN